MSASAGEVQNKAIFTLYMKKKEKIFFQKSHKSRGS